MKVRGVNLQNWLVLERWIGDSPLSMSNAVDEHDMMYEYEQGELDSLLEEHRSTYVTRETFKWLSEQGCNVVRIPIPYYIFGSEHHKSCSKYLNNAFQWAEETNIGILVELHTTQMGHNGADHCGYSGMCQWHHSKDRVDRTLAMLSRVVGRYRASPAFWGITPLNEPGTKKYIEFQKRDYRDSDKYWPRISKSTPITRKFLMQFYSDFYDMVRAVGGNDIRVVLCDHFYLPFWNTFMSDSRYKNVYMDTHKYVAFKEWMLGAHRLEDYINVIEKFSEEISTASKYHPVIVGEWATAARSIEKPLHMFEGMSEEQVASWYKTYTNAQIDAWDVSEGGFISTLRVSDDKDERRAAWSFEESVKRGWVDLRHGTSR